jgi:eukaryotic-like serine/threonine-protein kinase
LQDACKAATDITIAPLGSVPAKGSNTTWTATMMPGESLISTGSGIGGGTNSGTSSGITSGTGASLVTQEVELVYWKDIKDSTDMEDLQGFLAKFPAGIYADLARRRLKNLGVSMGKDADGSSLNAALSTVDMDKTLLVPRPEEVNTTAIVANAVAGTPAIAVPEPEPEPALPAEPVQAMPLANPTAVAAQPQSDLKSNPQSNSKSKTVLVLAGVALLAVAGVAFKLFSSPGAAPAPADQLAGPMPAASTPSTAASAPLAAALAASRPASALAGTRPERQQLRLKKPRLTKTAPPKTNPTKQNQAKLPTLLRRKLPGQVRLRLPQQRPTAHAPPAKTAC